MKSVFARIAAVVAGAVLLVASIMLCENGFSRIQDFHKLELIPPTGILGAVGGEVQLHGFAAGTGATLKAPKSGKACLYYRYRVQKKVSDSDGSHWSTVRDEQRAVDFDLDDGAARAKLLTHEGISTIKWSVPRSFYHRQGDYRYEEWRVDEGDSLTLFGWFTPLPSRVVSFTRPGQYVPIITGYSAESERADLGTTALLLLWGGVTCLILACLGAVAALRIHKTIVFLALVSLACAALLANYGYRSLKHDVRAGYDRVILHENRTKKLMQQTLAKYGIDYSGLDQAFDPATAGLDEDLVRRIQVWRINAYVVRARYLRQIRHFPENLYAASLGLNDPPKVALTAGEQTRAAQRLAGFNGTRVGTQLLLTLAGLILICGAAWFAFRVIRVKRMMENLATAKTAGVTYGLAEVKGKLKPEAEGALLSGPVSNEACTWHHYKIEERRGSGKNRRWHTIHDETKKQPFLCEDDEGAIRIFPTKAEIITKHLERNVIGDMRYSEWRLSPGDELYILGKARLDKTLGDRLVFGHEKGFPYIIANLPESVVMFRKALLGMGVLALALSVIFLCSIWIGGTNGQFSALDFVMASLVAPAFMIMVMIAFMYNDLVFLRERCERDWANIQVSLKKRSNLIPRLQNIAKTYLAHEAHLQRGLALLRSRFQQAKNASSVDEYMQIEHESINELNLRLEAYPELEGNAVVADLSRRLIKLENEVALIRAGFNEAVMQYHTRCESFPDILLARLFRFKRIDLLKFDQAAHEIPQVAPTLASQSGAS